MKKNEKGIALLVVLVLVLLIMGVGVVAYNQGKVNSEVSTNAQLKAILKQSSDNAMRLIEREIVRSGSSKCQPFATLSADQTIKCLNEEVRTQVVGYLNKQMTEGTGGEELAYCYRPLSNSDGTEIYSITKVTSLAKSNSGQPASSAKICNLNSSGDFNSKRNIAVTQIHFSTDPDNSRVCASGSCCDLAQNDPVCQAPVLFRADVISVSNLFTSATISDINTCLKKPVSDDIAAATVDKITLTECLNKKGIPYSAQRQEFMLQQKS